MSARRTLALLAAIAAIVSACAGPAPIPPPPIETQPVTRPNVLEGIAAYPMGDLHGDVALVLRGKPNFAAGSIQMGELWAVPLDGTSPRLLLRYPGGAVGVGYPQLGFTVLARQLSPDARRLVLSASFLDQTQFYGPQYRGRLVIVDLNTSDARVVGADDPRQYVNRPAWSPDGERIAYEGIGVPSFTGTGIYTMRTDGSDTRQLCTATSGADARGYGAFFGCAVVLGWSPDGRVAFAEVDGFSLVDQNGNIERSGYYLSSVTTVSWRKDRPQFATAIVADPHGSGIASPITGERQIIVGDMRRSTPTILARSPDVPLFDARWRPGADQVLFRKDKPPGSKVMLAAAGSATEIGREFTCPARAEWSTDGRTVVYLSECEGGVFTVRAIDVTDPSSRGVDRLLAQLPDAVGWLPVDLAVVRY
ncbi:MAG TPA: hypothetical protein VGQ86_02330 [Candidatus Limnocylindria bacterium]|nr:hypothetical protein [Candidatus Limnocylindria bacterium]